MIRLLLVVLIGLGVTNQGFADIKRMNPAWDLKKSKKTLVEEQREERENKEALWPPKFSMGAGVNIPELIPIEGVAMFGRWAALRLYYGPPIPFKIIVDMPSDITGKPSKSGLVIGYPDATIKFDAVFGPHYGFDVIGFPMGGSFFVSVGAGVRDFSIKGGTSSPFFACSVTEAAKEPPCPDPELRIQTRTQLVLGADTKSTTTLLRYSLGWRFSFLETGYMTLILGAVKPIKTKRNLDITADLDTPGTDADAELSEEIQEYRAVKEREMEEKSLKECRPYDEKALPILGLVWGILF